MPLKAKTALVYSPSTHGSLFLKNQIITIHDLIAINFPTQYKFQYYYFKYYVPLLIKKAKCIVAISEFTKKEIEKYYKIDPSKIKVIYNGISFSETKYSENEVKILADLVEDKPFFVCIGASFSHKNIETLLQSIKIVENLDVRYVIIGRNNKYFKRLIELAKELNLDNIVFLNYISDELLALLYTRALANIYISLYEGFGYPPMEAARFGTISVISDIPVLKEIYGESMLYVNPTDILEIANRLIDIVNSPISKNEVFERTNYLFSKYSWDNTIKSVNELILNVEK